LKIKERKRIIFENMKLENEVWNFKYEEIDIIKMKKKRNEWMRKNWIKKWKEKERNELNEKKIRNEWEIKEIMRIWIIKL